MPTKVISGSIPVWGKKITDKFDNMKITQFIGILALIFLFLLMTSLFLLHTELISLFNLGLIVCLAILFIGYFIVKIHVVRGK